MRRYGAWAAIVVLLLLSGPGCAGRMRRQGPEMLGAAGPAGALPPEIAASPTFAQPIVGRRADEGRWGAWPARSMPGASARPHGIVAADAHTPRDHAHAHAQGSEPAAGGERFARFFPNLGRSRSRGRLLPGEPPPIETFGQPAPSTPEPGSGGSGAGAIRPSGPGDLPPPLEAAHARRAPAGRPEPGLLPVTMGVRAYPDDRDLGLPAARVAAAAPADADARRVRAEAELGEGHRAPAPRRPAPEPTPAPEAADPSPVELPPAAEAGPEDAAPAPEPVDPPAPAEPVPSATDLPPADEPAAEPLSQAEFGPADAPPAIESAPADIEPADAPAAVEPPTSEIEPAPAPAAVEPPSPSTSATADPRRPAERVASRPTPGPDVAAGARPKSDARALPVASVPEPNPEPAGPVGPTLALPATPRSSPERPRHPGVDDQARREAVDRVLDGRPRMPLWQPPVLTPDEPSAPAGPTFPTTYYAEAPRRPARPEAAQPPGPSRRVLGRVVDLLTFGPVRRAAAEPPALPRTRDHDHDHDRAQHHHRHNHQPAPPPQEARGHGYHARRYGPPPDLRAAAPPPADPEP